MKMKHDKNKKVISESEEIEGLFECSFEHKIEKTSASLTWVGPTIPKEEWQRVLAFFQWTYDTYKSESQVRLYVNVQEQTWAAWAYPQEAKSGMSAREVVNDESKKQREQFDATWLYFGTVHHHCSMSAFQSGVDLENEKGQDGIHITVGKMDEKVYDIHARFYRKGLCFEPDLSWFWDTGDIMAECPVQFQKFLPKDIRSITARRQMCEPSTVPFPEIWKLNMIEIKKPEVWVSPSMFPDYHSNSNTHSTFSPETVPLWQRARAAWKEIIYHIKHEQYELDEIQDAIGDLGLGAHEIILKACLHHKCDVDDLDREMPNFAGEIIQSDIEQSIPAPKAIADAPSTESMPGDPDWSGYGGG